MGTAELVAGLIVFAVGCTIQGVIGFGAGLFSIPILAQIDPQFVPGPVIMASPLMTGLFAWRERAAVNIGALKWALVGRVPGVVLGALALTAVSEDRLGVLFGLLLLVGIGLKVSGLQIRRTPTALFGVGGLAGFMGTSVGVGGPPIALVFHDESGPEIRSTLNAFFMVGASMSLAVLAAFGRFGGDDLVISAWMLLSVLIGFAISGPLRSVLDRGWLSPAVYLMSAVAAIVLMVRSVV
ncbi:MAG TPA: hypothetical protein DGF10_00485 [Acidimicrobiaceae bacterium]|nr:hypothetical protein [Acidimicrobiaceae bacterium]HCV33114.1 hypothetical protein [Acidimicrobiaceae bacterium]|tara:strand:+ start:1891 stop:2607 length:717 start_codon:yes stop_codon:yes gene_type:complete